MKRLRARKVLAALLGLSLLALPALGAAETRLLGLGEALSLAEQASPVLKAALAREAGAQAAVTGAQAGWFPTLDLSAVDSTGLPGSASGLDGFAGLDVSPYRKGPSADAFAKWDLVDASVWHAASAARFQAEAGHEEARLVRAQVDEQALKTYLEAVLYRGDEQAWANLVQALRGVRETVDQYVRNGQYSEVQGLLIADQLDDADMNAQDFERKYRSVLARLGLLTGLGGRSFACPAPMGLGEGGLMALLQEDGAAPLLLRADDEAKAAAETAKGFGAENLPKVELGGSVGYLQDTRLVNPAVDNSGDYSAFVGATLPLFEGFKIAAGERVASKETEAREQERLEARLSLDDFNERLGEQIAEGREDLERLLPEQARAARAVTLARSRYLKFLGPLSDLQEALKDRVGVDSRIAEVKTQLLLALGTRVFVNGGAPSGGR